MAGKREESWVKARQTFVTLCLKEFKLEIGRQRILSELINKLDGDIIKFLKICDVIDPKATQVITNPKGDAALAASLLADFLEAAVEFRKFSTELTSKIQSKIDGIKQANPQNSKAKENTIRALKVFKTELGSLDKSNESWLAIRRTELEAKTKEMTTFEMLARDWSVILKAALARALAAAQRVKADPKPATYNKEFPRAARDITQQISNVKMLAGKGIKVPGPADPEPLCDRLQPFANGELKSLDVEQTTNEQVLAAISAFNKAVKAVADAYQGHV